jgi:Heme exporter protein D (CcmD)
MTYVPFIAGSYAVSILAVLGLSVNAWFRHGQAARRLAALEAGTPRRRDRKK